MVNPTSKYDFLGQVYHVNSCHYKKLNTRRERELAQNQAEPENQAELVPGPDPEPKKNFKIFFQKIKPKPLLVQHVKGQPAPSTYVRKKGCITFDTNRATPCIMHSLNRNPNTYNTTE